MNTTFIILVSPTRTEICIFILSLLLVVSIVGYVSALVYYRSSFMRVIKAIRAEKNELRNRMIGLYHEKKKLTNHIKEKEKEIEQLTANMNILKSLFAGTVHEKDELLIKNMRKEQSGLKKENETIAYTEKRKY
jgi:peptidoglycan hydrolase CwlO-like protein